MTPKSFSFRNYQKEAGKVLAEILFNKRFALDGSDTGVGKTFTAIAAALEFDSPPVAVICRAKAKTKWIEALALFNLKPVFVMSWEKSRGANEFFLPVMNNRRKVMTFNLRLAEPTLVIIDEIHSGGAIKSQNAELVIAAKRCPLAYVLGLSATVADSPLKMRSVGFCTGLHTLGEDFWLWCRRNGCGKSPFGGMYFRKRDRERVLGTLHKTLFSGKDPWGVRLRKKDLMDIGEFPECETFVELWDIPAKSPGWLMPYLDEIRDDEIADDDKFEGETPTAILAIRERQRSELMKVPALLEEIEDLVEAGEHPVIFMQYVRTIKAVMAKVKGDFSVIAGSWCGKKTEDEMNKFQTGKTKIALCQTDAASESIDLHDVIGNCPRHVIIFPTYKAVTLIQVHGRTVRSGGLTPVVQRLVYAAGGIEEKISRVVERRLENLAAIMDGELTAGGMF
jgi:superfamily II DNA or RNA helicase